MKLLSKLFLINQKRNKIILLVSLYCLFLLLLRAKIMHSFYLFFLIWNLILAVIPYLISSYILTLENIENKKTVLFLILFVWLLFLPNSFYIITDLVHIVNSKKQTFWFDLVLISSYSIVGFILGLLSLLDFERIITRVFSQKTVSFVIPIICLLSGFGIYLGRILRFNSWEIISNPRILILDSLKSVLSSESILFTINFGVFIYITFLIKKKK
jgi:uncharacterized membrane protein